MKAVFLSAATFFSLAACGAAPNKRMIQYSVSTAGTALAANEGLTVAYALDDAGWAESGGGGLKTSLPASGDFVVSAPSVGTHRVALTAWVCALSDDSCATALVPPAGARQTADARDISFGAQASDGGLGSPVQWALILP